MKYTKTKTALALVLFFGEVSYDPNLGAKFIEDDSDFSFVNKLFGNYSFGFNSASACDEFTGGGGCYWEDNFITIVGERIDRDHEIWLASIRSRNAQSLVDSLTRPAQGEFGDNSGGGGQGNSLGDIKKTTGCTDPITLATRNHWEVEADFVGNGELPLKVIRTYNSNSIARGGFGPKWTSNLAAKFIFDIATPTEIKFNLFDGTALKLTNDSYVNGVYLGFWRNASGKIFNLSKNTDGSWTLISGKYTENYYSSGLIHTVQIPNGEKLTYNYVNGNDKFSHLTSLAHNSGQNLQIIWATGTISKIIDPAGNSYDYTYLNANGPLVYVNYPSEVGISRKSYLTLSNEKIFRMDDENGNIFATWTFDATDGGAKESRSDNGQNIYKVNKPIEVNATTRTTTTINPFNKSTTYTFKKIGDNWKKTSVVGEQLGSCAGTTKSITYDNNGFKDLVTDHNGNITDYDINAEGKLIKTIEAVGMPEVRTTFYEYDSIFGKISKITTALSETSYIYNTSGLLNTHTIKNISANGIQNETKTASYSYTFHPSGIMKTKTVDGPRTDVSDFTTTHYNSTGYITKITNALGHNTTFSGHNVFGNPSLMTLPDGTVNRRTYNKRGWLTKAESDIYGEIRVTTYTLDKVGQLVNLTQPDNSQLSFVYDSVRRLIRTVRNNNQSQYTEYN